MIEKKSETFDASLMPPDIKLTITHASDQSGLKVKVLNLLVSKLVPLIHLKTLLCQCNGLEEDEWPNIELYPVEEHLTLEVLDGLKAKGGGTVRPLKFNSSLWNVLQTLFPEEEDYIGSLALVYRRKPITDMMSY